MHLAQMGVQQRPVELAEMECLLPIALGSNPKVSTLGLGAQTGMRQAWWGALVRSFHISNRPKPRQTFCVLVWELLDSSAEDPIGLPLTRLNPVENRLREGQASCEGIRFARYFARQIFAVWAKASLFEER
jgi:hypothetical protein